MHLYYCRKQVVKKNDYLLAIENISIALQMNINGVDSVIKMLESLSRKAFVLCIVLHILSALITRGGWRKVCVGRGSRHPQLIDHLSLLDFCNRGEEKLYCTKWDDCRGTFFLM